MKALSLLYESSSMDRKELNTNLQIWCCLLASIVLLTVVAGDDNAPSSGSSQSQCGSNNNQHNRSDNLRLMIVSTLDGKVTALNIEKEGLLEWSVDAGVGPLLSSSISSLEINGRNGVTSKLIPSLDGSLYQFDGEEIEAMPFTADTLLSSSFKFNDDSVIVGGKETVTYGVDSVTGKVKYVCSMNGCTRFGQDEVSDNEILVVERTSKTVRAVEMRTGAENWNFSVGQHEMSFIKSSKRDIKTITEEQAQTTKNSIPDEDAWVDPCNTQDEEDFFKDFWDFEWWNQHESLANIKVVVPDGLVVAVDKGDPQNILWKHQFKSPISNAWYLKDGELQKMSLFDDKNVPALENNESTEGSDNFQLPEMPLLYLGKFQNQIYVQPSERMKKQVNKATQKVTSKTGDMDMPKIRWRPYIATAPSRTPAITHDTTQDVSFAKDEESHHDNNQYEVSIWHNQYPFDSGMYLFPDFSPLELETDEANSSQYEGFGNEVTVTLWNWWREVLMISIVSSILVHIVLTKMKKVCENERDVMEQQLLSSKGSQRSWSRSESDGSIGRDMPSMPDLESKAREYVSRYETDFEQKECLGRGGFGVVFSAINRVDDCSYAIKRIALNNSDRAKQKVMREVKALAKLDHVGIVRYYQSWFESPPPGWQEERDKSLEDFTSPAPSAVQSDPSTIPSTPITPTTGFHSNTEHIPKEPKKTSFYLGDLVANKNPLNPFKAEDLLGFSESQSKSGIKKQGSSEGFIPHQTEIDMELSTEESGSFSIGFGTPNGQNHKEDSFEIDFVDTEDDSNGNIPFDIYKSKSSKKPIEILDDTNDSFNIVFEDSGCGDHEKVHKQKGLADITNSDGTTTATESESVWSLAEKGTVGLKFRTHTASSESVKIHRRNRSEPFDTTSKRSSVEHCSSVPNVIRPDTLAIQKLRQEQGKMPNTPVGKLYLYIQMQLCREESLKDWLNNNTLRRDRQQCLDIFDQIVSAVDYVHKCGLMHRDLKPSNIFFAMDGSVKVGDFGLVTASEEQCEDALTPLVGKFDNSKHTDQVGTKLYMSPEQCAGKAYNCMVDIYSLGLIFFELFYPFDTQMERIKTITEVKKLMFPRRFQRELPEECEFVKNLLSHDADKRPTASQILQNSLLREFDKARKAVSRISCSRSRTLTSSSQDSG